MTAVVRKLSPVRSGAARPVDADLLERVFDRIVGHAENVKCVLAEHPEIRAEAKHSPQLVEMIVAYVFAEIDALQPHVRQEFAGEPGVPRRSAAERSQLVNDVLTLFDGRNPGEVARRLGIGRATVYRIIKRQGQAPRK